MVGQELLGSGKTAREPGHGDIIAGVESFLTRGVNHRFMTRGDTALAEKRVYDATAGTTDLYLAASAGIVRVTVSGDTIGEFSLVSREPSRDVTAVEKGKDRHDQVRRIGVAAESDVSVAETEDAFEPVSTGFGPAQEIGSHRGDLIAVGDDGTVARLPEAKPKATWDHLGELSEVRAVEGSLLATPDGVYRIADGGLHSVGLSDVNDIDAIGVPLAATQTGVYQLGNGWMKLLEGRFDLVASDGGEHVCLSGQTDDGDPRTIIHSGSDWVSGWDNRPLPVENPAAVIGYGRGLVAAATADGVVCVDTGEGWRQRSIGVRGVTGLAVVTRSE